MNPLLWRLILATHFVWSASISLGQTNHFVGAPAPEVAKASPLTPEEQRAAFTVSPGFTIELVAADPEVSKAVAFNFDDAGRLWVNTATEYPLDGNESGDQARTLYEKGGRDQILVFETPTAAGRQTPRVFADGLAMPMGILPYCNGAIVGQGPEIFFLADTNGDLRADAKQMLLTGFGIQDSHLMPHQFTRGPGGWIYFAQGAFNSSQVQTREGTTVSFDQCKMGRFQPDGTRFEVVQMGLNNIWGFVIDRVGEMFIQEANDLGYPVVPFFIGGSYPGIGMHKFRPHSPWQPPLAKLEMGGTGLSGLALAEGANTFPAPYRDVMYVANPITGKIQAIRIHREGSGYRLEKLPDFVLSSDPWFRPIAIQFGPDGCLYILDWYNKIISHNEVPRTHPERDKNRSRIWRVRHDSMPPQSVPNMTHATPGELLNHLSSLNAWEPPAAMRQIVDRQLVELEKPLIRLAEQSSANLPARLNAFWALEGLRRLPWPTLEKLADDSHRAIRRESVRAAASTDVPLPRLLGLLKDREEDPDPQVLTEIVRTVRARPELNNEAIALLLRLAKPQMDGPKIKTQQGNEWTYAAGPAADRAFLRSLIRTALEPSRPYLERFLMSRNGKKLSLENQVFAALALGGKSGAQRLADLSGRLDRRLHDEELLLLASAAGEPEVDRAFQRLLQNHGSQSFTLRTLVESGTRITNAAFSPQIAQAARSLAARQPGEASAELLVRAAATFRLRELEQDIVQVLEATNRSPELRLASVKALRSMNSPRPDLFQRLAVAAKPSDPMQREALVALASDRSGRALPALLEIWPILPMHLRKLALERWTTTESNARDLLNAIKRGELTSADLDEATTQKLKTLLGDQMDLAAVGPGEQSTHAVLRLTGGDADYVAEPINLVGAFTVETWVKLDDGIGNEDGILGRPGGPDINFSDRFLRVYLGPTNGDAIIASRRIEPNSWTHVAVTRDSGGEFHLYIDGQLDPAKGQRATEPLTGLQIGRTTPNRGTSGVFSEFRVWNVARSQAEIAETFEVSLHGSQPPAGLVQCLTGVDWGTLHGEARVIRTPDFVRLRTPEEVQEEQQKFAQFSAIAGRPGVIEKGKAIFAANCMTCHSVHGEGAQLGPPLNGAGALGLEALLRSLLTPNAAVESGYYRFRVELKNGDLREGFLVSQNETGLVLREIGGGEQHLSRDEIKRSAFTKMSLMPEGLLEGMEPGDVSDLIAYLMTLK